MFLCLIVIYYILQISFYMIFIFTLMNIIVGRYQQMYYWIAMAIVEDHAMKLKSRPMIRWMIQSWSVVDQINWS